MPHPQPLVTFQGMKTTNMLWVVIFLVRWGHKYFARRSLCWWNAVFWISVWWRPTSTRHFYVGVDCLELTPLHSFFLLHSWMILRGVKHVFDTQATFFANCKWEFKPVVYSESQMRTSWTVPFAHIKLVWPVSDILCLSAENTVTLVKENFSRKLMAAAIGSGKEAHFYVLCLFCTVYQHLVK